MQKLHSIVRLGLAFAIVASAAAVHAQDLQGFAEVERLAAAKALAPSLAQKGIDSFRDLRVSASEADEFGMRHVRLQQTYGGIPVFGAQTIVHFDRAGRIADTTDATVATLAMPNVKPGLSADEAIGFARKKSGVARPMSAPPHSELVMFPLGNDLRLAYKVRLEYKDGTAQTSIPVRFIDAATGKVIDEYDNLQTGTGPSLYSGAAKFPTAPVSKNYWLEDPTRGIGVFDFAGLTDQPHFRFGDKDDVWNTAYQRPAIDAYLGSLITYDYYKKAFGRIGIDGKGGPLTISYVGNDSVGLAATVIHYGKDYNNAFWDGQMMTCGDGDGKLFSPIVTIDVMGHEMTHGVTQFTAGLIYKNESGALNESMSDIFGCMVERFAYGESAATWLVGEQCFTPGRKGDALRYLNNPRAGDQPDHYHDLYKGKEDNGGVHTNSGIPNHAFYLLAVGGKHRLGGSMKGIGADKAAAIWYRALTKYMTPKTNFSQAKAATLKAANDIFKAGSTEAKAVESCWTLVGVR